MKSVLHRATSLALLAIVLLAGHTAVKAMGSAFTYQGRLIEGEAAASGSYDLSFSLYDAPTGGSQVGLTVTNPAVTVSNGLFVVTLDFGANVFDGSERWLELGVRKGANPFTLLSPRQEITPTPYAVTAASLSAPLPESQLPSGIARLNADQVFTGSNSFSGVVVAGNAASSFVGNFSGDGSGLTNLDASAVTVATNDLNTALSAKITTATNASWIASTNRVADATNDLNTALLLKLAAATNAPWIASTNAVVAATNDLSSALSAKITAATNAPWIASTSAVAAATNDLNTALSVKIVAATNAPWIASTNAVAAATNSLNTALVARLVAATNDLNTTLSARIVAATNAPWIASTSLVAAATNDLNAALSARIVDATNALWIATTNWVIVQGLSGTNGLTRKPISTPAPSNATNYVADFGNEVVQILATNHITLVQSTNRPAAGWYGECVWYIQGGTANWTLRVNSNWTGVGTLAASTPYLINSNKLTIVALSARGGSETNVTYAISRQE